MRVSVIEPSPPTDKCPVSSPGKVRVTGTDSQQERQHLPGNPISSHAFSGQNIMNLHPKVRPLWQRALIVPALTFLMIYKALHLPRRILPRDLRSIVKNWHLLDVLAGDQERCLTGLHRRALYVQDSRILPATTEVDPQYCA